MSAPGRAWKALVDPKNRADWALGAAGALFGSVSLVLPFGRDQGLYYYVGREWLQRGAMPYRDAFEQKTPGIFFLHAIAIALFGEHQASIRVLELACVVALGIVCAWIATPADEAPAPGVRGASVLAACVLYFGFFDFWDSAQCEIWCTTAAMASACAVIRMRRERVAALVGGVLGGAAIVLKPPGATLVAIAGAVVVARAWRGAVDRRGWRAAQAALVFTGGTLAFPGIVVAYFAAKGALPAMIDVLVGANRWYFEHERGVQSAFDVAQHVHDFYKDYEPLSALLVEALAVAIVVGVARRDRALRDRHLFALAACAAAWIAVVAQLKFYYYHFGLAIGPMTLVVANLAIDANAIARWRVPDRAPSLGAIVLGANLAGAYALTGRHANMWSEEAAAAVAWASGRIDREEFARRFNVDVLGYHVHETEQVGLWLRENTSPDDEVAVRGFEPEIYVVSRRHFSGRFFATSFLTDPRRAYKREEWLAQDRAQLLARPPRWVVAVTWSQRGDVESPEYFEAMGYVERRRIERFVVMERGESRP